MSDECIRQAPTSAFAHGDADITFRQTCIGKHAGEAEILFPIRKVPTDPLLISHVESSYLTISLK